MYDNEIKDKFVELRAAGKSFGDISQELGIVKSTLHRWEEERADDIARLRRIEWEEQEHRWGRNIEELMTDLAGDMSDYNMRLRQFTDNLNNLSLRDTVMLLRESRREYFRLRAMLMGTARRPRSPKKTAPSVPPRSMTEDSPLPRAAEAQSLGENEDPKLGQGEGQTGSSPSSGFGSPLPVAAEPQTPNGVHDRLGDSSEGVLICPLGATTEHGLQRPVTEEQQRGSAKAPEESNETERFQQNGTTQRCNINDLQLPQPDSFHFPGVGGVSSVEPHFSPQPSEDSNPSSTDVVNVSANGEGRATCPHGAENPKSDPDDEFLGSIVVSPYECGAAVVLKTLEQEVVHRERLAGR